MKEFHPEKQRKGKKIFIQEVKDDNSNDELRAKQTGELVGTPPQSIFIPIYTDTRQKTSQGPFIVLQIHPKSSLTIKVLYA